MLAVAERRARPKADRFDRPLRDGGVFLHHLPVRQLPDTGLLSLSPILLRPAVATLWRGLRFAGPGPSSMSKGGLSGLRRTGQDDSSAYTPKPLSLALMGLGPRLC
jgi:hypothetical protein